MVTMARLRRRGSYPVRVVLRPQRGTPENRACVDDPRESERNLHPQ